MRNVDWVCFLTTCPNWASSESMGAPCVSWLTSSSILLASSSTRPPLPAFLAAARSYSQGLSSWCLATAAANATRLPPPPPLRLPRHGVVPTLTPFLLILQRRQRRQRHHHYSYCLAAPCASLLDLLVSLPSSLALVGPAALTPQSPPPSPPGPRPRPASHRRPRNPRTTTCAEMSQASGFSSPA